MAEPDRTATARPTLVWSDDGATVTKARKDSKFRLLDEAFDSFDNELRVNLMFLRQPPPVRTARLVAGVRRPGSMTFEAVRGAPLGPKYPLELSPADIDSLTDLVEVLARYRPRRRWFRRLPIAGRLRHHVAAGVIASADADLIRDVFRAEPPRWKFSHGDVTARNVVRAGDQRGGLVLIDWEWAGLYPEEYELAFLWFSLVDVDGARPRVAARVPAGRRRAFVASALLVQLLHLDMWAGRGDVGVPRPRHLTTRDELLEELRALAP